MLSANFAFTATTLSSVSGASNFSFGTNGTDPKIFGGLILNAAACNGTGSVSCNSCDGTCANADAICACNKTGIQRGLILSLGFTTTLNTTGRKLKIKGNGATEYEATITGTNTFVLNNKTWDELANLSSQDLSTSGGKTWTLTATLTKTDGTTEETGEKVTITMNVDAIDQAVDDHTPARCPGGEGVSYQGICYYEIKPGDAKVYFESVQGASNFPAASSASDIKYTKLVFFYAEGAAALPNIKNNSSSFEVEIDGNGEFDDRIRASEIKNEHQYCFVLGQQNSAGNIVYFEDPATADATKVCATPSLVEGLLADKKCFIATAAFGSSLSPFVETLRQFRAQFLAPYSWGQKFIKFYYEHSPKLAKSISSNEGLQAVTRMALWPIVAFAGLSLRIGMAPSVAIVLGSFLFIGIWAFRRKKRRT